MRIRVCVCVKDLNMTAFMRYMRRAVQLCEGRFNLLDQFMDVSYPFLS